MGSRREADRSSTEDYEEQRQQVESDKPAISLSHTLTTHGSYRSTFRCLLLKIGVQVGWTKVNRTVLRPQAFDQRYGQLDDLYIPILALCSIPRPLPCLWYFLVRWSVSLRER
jgi:hypothetical protein